MGAPLKTGLIIEKSNEGLLTGCGKDAIKLKGKTQNLRDSNTRDIATPVLKECEGRNILEVRERFQ